jgi:cytochrome c556
MQKFILILIAMLIPLVGSAVETNDEAIMDRKAAFKELKEAVADTKKAMKADDFAAAKLATGNILTNAMAVTNLFPEGSYEGDTRAKKKIWEKRDNFNERQQKLVSDAEMLYAATDSNDPKQLKTAFKTLAKNCKGCHMRYRQIF